MAQLREGSVIKKVGGDEVIATVTELGKKADKTYVDNKIKTDTEFMVGRAYDTTEGIIPGNY